MIDNLKSGKLGLTNNQLKIIAMITMIIDHVGVALFPSTLIFRQIGRISFPIYAYLIAEGCRHTRSRKRYLGFIAIMALVFQAVYTVFLGSLYQGILVTFSLAIGLIFALEGVIKPKALEKRLFCGAIVLLILFIGVACPIIFKEHGFQIDYDIWGLTLPVLVYFAPNKKVKIVALLVFLTVMSAFSSGVQWWSLLSVPLLALYNGERGKRNMKYFFYILYPLHLVIIYGIMFLMMFFK